MKFIKWLELQKFANPLLPTNGTNELQERYATNILKVLRKINNLRMMAGRDYEGSPKAGAVQIPVRDTEVAVADYDVASGTSLTTSATSYLQVLVDKNKAVNELIDGYEPQAVPDNIVAQRIDSAGYSMARTAELDFITALKTGTAETSTTALTNSTAYNSISASIGELLKLGIDINTIKVAVTTDVEGLLLTDTKYTNTASSVGSERAAMGVVNRIRGAEVLRSDNLGLINTTNNVEYIVFSTDYAQAGDEWKVMPTIEKLADGAHIGSSALQGRWVYFNKLTRATGARIKHDAAV